MKDFKQRMDEALYNRHEAASRRERVDASKAIADLIDEAEARMEMLEKALNQALEVGSTGLEWDEAIAWATEPELYQYREEREKANEG